MELKKIFCNHKCNGQIFAEREKGHWKYEIVNGDFKRVFVETRKKIGRHFIQCSKCGKRKFVD